MRFCEERGMGFPTAGGPVPIVVGARAVRPRRRGRLRPTRCREGYAACEAASATTADVALGRSGRAPAPPSRSGKAARSPVGAASAARSVEHDGVCGRRTGRGQRVRRRARGRRHRTARATASDRHCRGVVRQHHHRGDRDERSLTKRGCLLVAESGHDGLSRSLAPVHSTADGDALIAAATGVVEARSRWFGRWPLPWWSGRSARWHH